jgi:hypothetical protein
MVLDPIFAMAGDTQVIGQAQKEMLYVGGMGIVAIDAFGAGGQGVVFDFTLAGQLLDILMATQAQGLGLFHQQLFEFGVVRVMTADAALFGSVMAELE